MNENTQLIATTVQQLREIEELAAQGRITPDELSELLVVADGEMLSAARMELRRRNLMSRLRPVLVALSEEGVEIRLRGLCQGEYSHAPEAYISSAEVLVMNQAAADQVRDRLWAELGSEMPSVLSAEKVSEKCLNAFSTLEQLQ